MENVAFDLPQYYPPVPLPPYALGEVKDLFSFDFSLNVLFRFEVWLLLYVLIQSMLKNMQHLVLINV
jgi:hypothetical protein